MDEWRSAPAVFWAMLLPGAIWLTFFFFVPLAFVWSLALGERVGPAEIVITGTLDNYRQALDPLYRGLFWKSIWVAAVATAICLVVAFPVAMAITFAPQQWKTPLLIMVVLPFWTNFLIRTYAMIAVLRENGYLNYLIEYIWLATYYLLAPIGVAHWLGSAYKPISFLYSDFAVIFGIVYVYMPFAILPLYASLERLDRALLEASLDLGASQTRTFFRIVVPLASPGIASAVILVFIPALGTFLISDLLGGPQSQLIGNIIERQFKAANNVPLGAALSFLLIYATFAILALWAWLAGRRSRHASN